jgi:hypothetical protein
MRSDTHIIYDLTAYLLTSSQTTSSKSQNKSITGLLPIQWAIRIWIKHYDNSTTELTSDYSAIVTRTTNGLGFQNTTLTIPETYLDLGFDVLECIVYMRFGTGSWQALSIFASVPLMYPKIEASTWTVSYYTYRLTLTGNTYAYFFYGTSTYNSLIDYVQFKEPSVYDLMMYRLRSGNLVGFITLPYTNLIGNTFYGLILLLFCVPLYTRFHSLNPILFLFVVFGGAGGFFTVLMPIAGLTLSWAILALGLTGLLYKVFR